MMVRLKGCVTVAWGEALSLTCTVKLKEPLAVGVPKIVPVVGEIFNPAGSESPALRFHE